VEREVERRDAAVAVKKGRRRFFSVSPSLNRIRTDLGSLSAAQAFAGEAFGTLAAHGGSLVEFGGGGEKVGRGGENLRVVREKIFFFFFFFFETEN